MHCVLLIYGNESSQSHEEQMLLRDDLVAYTDAMYREGVFRGHHTMRPSSEARNVRSGKVHHGPAVDGSLHLIGYYLVDVPDMHSAVEWAKRCPGAKHETIEVRPVWE